jgi:STE24 endopeptidase
MDGSKRSAKSNAFFTGFGPTKKIVLFDTLIRNHSVDELVAVLAHEIAHFKFRHIIRHLALNIVTIGIFFFLASVCIREPALFRAFGIDSVSVYAGLTLFAIVCIPLGRILSIVTAFRSRAHEFEADRFAAQTTGHPGAMISALEKLSKNNLSNPAPHPLAVFLHHSHPPILRRIAAIRAAPQAT